MPCQWRGDLGCDLCSGTFSVCAEETLITPEQHFPGITSELTPLDVRAWHTGKKAEKCISPPQELLSTHRAVPGLVLRSQFLSVLSDSQCPGIFRQLNVRSDLSG